MKLTQFVDKKAHTHNEKKNEFPSTKKLKWYALILKCFKISNFSIGKKLTFEKNTVQIFFYIYSTSFIVQTESREKQNKRK